jgi:hypothetical protein
MRVYDKDRDDPSKITTGSTVLEGFMNKQRIIRTILSLFIILIGLTTSAGGGGTRWKTIRVDAGRTFRDLTNSSLKLNISVTPNIPAVAYGSDHLYYATQVEGDFETTIVDANWGVGMFASLALDPTNGYPRISYYDQTKDNLKYAEYNEVLGVPVWSTRSLTSGGNTSAIALDNSSAHLPHIIYSNHDRHIRHTWLSCSSCSWSSEDVDMAVEFTGVNIAFAIDSSDNLYIAYYDSLTTSLIYGYKTDGIWHKEVWVYGREPAMVLTLSGYPAIAYQTDTSISYKYFTGTTWDVSTVYNDPATTGYPGGVAVQLPNDDPSQPLISFIDDEGSVRLAYMGEMETACPGRTSGYDYTCDKIDDYSTYRSFTSLITDTSNPSYNLTDLAYINEATGELQYRFESTPDVWGSQAIDFSTNAGLSSSLAVDDSGPHIAYYDRDTTSFKYAGVNDSTPGGCGDYGLNAWYKCESLDHAVVGSYDSVAIGIDGFPRIAFYDRSQPGALRFGSLNPLWSSIIIDDSSADIGRYASMDLNPASDRMAIAYMDYTNGRLKYAKERSAAGGNCGPGGFWSCEYIDTIGQGGFGISLTFGYNNVPLISYLDGDAQLVKVARYTGTGTESTCANSTNWNCAPIAPGFLTDRGQTSIWANTANSQIMVSWYQYNISASNLMWSQYSMGSGWQTPEVVADAMLSGEQNSLTVIGSMPVIAYTDGRFNRNALNYAYRVGVDGDCDSIDKWSCEVLDSAGSTGFFPSIKNISGRLYISYYDWTNGDLMLTFQSFSFMPHVVKP